MTRQDALQVLAENLKNTNLLKHSLAVEACLRALASKLGESEELWALAGLLHDVDYEKTGADPSRHGLEGAELLAKMGFDDALVRAVKVHSGHLSPQSKLDWALFATDPLTGLIVASALMHPEKKLSAVDVDFILRRFKEKRFAAGANREQIETARNLGLELEEFIGICLEGMQGVSGELGL